MTLETIREALMGIPDVWAASVKRDESGLVLVAISLHTTTSTHDHALEARRVLRAYPGRYRVSVIPAPDTMRFEVVVE